MLDHLFAGLLPHFCLVTTDASPSACANDVASSRKKLAAISVTCIWPSARKDIFSGRYQKKTLPPVANAGYQVQEPMDKMFREIVVAVDGSREAGRALEVAVHLAKRLDASLRAISVIEPLSSYTAFATAVDASLSQSLTEDSRQVAEALLSSARQYASSEDVSLSTDLLEGAEVSAIVDYIVRTKIDLLIIGLPHHDFHITRLWSSVYSISQAIPCSVLGVH